MTAKEFLTQAWKIDKRIEKRIEERNNLESRLTAARVSRLSGMPRGGARDWTDAAASVADMTVQIDAEINELCRVKRLVNEAIDAVEDAKCRRLLELRYRNYLSWDSIAEETHYDVSWIHKLHGRALLMVRVPEEFARR